MANQTRTDAEAYLPLAAKAGVRPYTTAYLLSEATTALDDLRHGRITGPAMLIAIASAEHPQVLMTVKVRAAATV